MNVMRGTYWGRIGVPAWVTDHESFLQWVDSGVIPEEARVGFIDGKVWVDDMPERAFAHNQIKTSITHVLHGLARAQKLGRYFGDGMLYTSREEGFSTVPDGMFIARATIDAGRARLEGGKRSHHDTRLVGVPDVVVEVVSRTSEVKDNEWLMPKYHNIGVPEFWVIDAQREPLRFTIHVRGPTEYVPVSPVDGWTESAVFGRSFRFTEDGSDMGFDAYMLEVR